MQLKEVKKMSKMDFRKEDNLLLFKKAFLKVFDSEEGQIIFDYLTFKYQDNLKANFNNVNINFYKLGEFELVKDLKKLYNNLKEEKEYEETKIEY